MSSSVYSDPYLFTLGTFKYKDLFIYENEDEVELEIYKKYKVYNILIDYLIFILNKNIENIKIANIKNLTLSNIFDKYFKYLITRKLLDESLSLSYLFDHENDICHIKLKYNDNIYILILKLENITIAEFDNDRLNGCEYTEDEPYEPTTFLTINIKTSKNHYKYEFRYLRNLIDENLSKSNFNEFDFVSYFNFIDVDKFKNYLLELGYTFEKEERNKLLFSKIKEQDKYLYSIKYRYIRQYNKYVIKISTEEIELNRLVNIINENSIVLETKKIINFRSIFINIDKIKNYFSRLGYTIDQQERNKLVISKIIEKLNTYKYLYTFEYTGNSNFIITIDSESLPYNQPEQSRIRNVSMPFGSRTIEAAKLRISQNLKEKEKLEKLFSKANRNRLLEPLHQSTLTSSDNPLDKKRLGQYGGRSIKRQLKRYK